MYENFLIYMPIILNHNPLSSIRLLKITKVTLFLSDFCFVNSITICNINRLREHNRNGTILLH